VSGPPAARAAGSVAGSAPTVLVVHHEHSCGPGHVGRWLSEAGVVLRDVRPYAGEEVPDRADADGLVVCGGGMGAWDDVRAPWLPAVRGLLRAAVEDRVPTLGLCLGGQLLAAACGGVVAPGARGPEIGVLPVSVTADAADDPLFRDTAPGAESLQWHLDAIATLPPGAVLVATGETYPHQAFRLGDRAWGLQFHPEALPDEVARWAVEDGVVLAEQGLAADGLVEVLVAAQSRLTATWHPLADGFARVVWSAHTQAEACADSQSAASSRGMGRAIR